MPQMVDRELSQTLYRLRRATHPEQIFVLGDPPSEETLKRQYRRLLFLVHPDRNRDATAEASEAFHLLQKWYTLAQHKIAAGTYAGNTSIRIISPRRVYTGSGESLAGDLCDLYPAQTSAEPVLVKAVRSPRNNDLMQAEATAMQRLDRVLAGDPLRAHFPTLVESFHIDDGSGQRRQANVVCAEEGTVSLAEVIAAYPGGVGLADAAWMINRLLAALAIAHDQGLVHGAVVPSHLLLRLADHNGILIDWCYSVETGGAVPAVSPSYRHYAPPEVAARCPATAATDLYMAAQCMVDLLGGDVRSDTLPPSLPASMVALLRACLIPNPSRRMQDAWTVFESFREILARLYGPPHFRPFVMPGHPGGFHHSHEPGA